MKVLLIYPNLQLMQLMPPSIIVLSSYLKSKGVEVELFDTTLYKLTEKSTDEIRVDMCQVRPFKFEDDIYKKTDMYDDLTNKIDEFKPDLIGISATDFTFNLGEALAKKIKEKFNTHIIMGGIHPTFMPEHAISSPYVDSICIGEGEEPLYELVNRLVNKQNIYDIKNLWIKQGGSVVKNGLRPPIDINHGIYDDPFVFDEKRMLRPMQGKIQKMMPIQIDRGCPFSCTFCAAKGFRDLYKGSNYLRVKNVDNLISEIEFLVNKYNPTYLYFTSETFFARPIEHIREFASKYKKIGLPFWCETRVETITKETAQLLKEMNCDRISLGLESGNEQYRRKMLNKTFTNDQFLNSVCILQDAVINISINNIIGLPEETRDMVFDTINLNRMISNKTDVTFNVAQFVPYSGSTLKEFCKEKNYLIEGNLFGEFQVGLHTIKTCLKNQPMHEREIRGLLRTFPLYIKMPKDYLTFIEIAETGDSVFRTLKSIYFEKYFKTN